MRSYTMKLTVATLAAATALSLTACGPENNDPAGAAGPGGDAPGAIAPATAGATGGGGTVTAPPGGATGGKGASAPAGGAAGGASPTGGAGTGGAAAGGAGASGGAAGGAGAAPKAANPVKVGQPATVDFTDKQSQKSAKLEVVVTGYEMGNIKELEAAKISTKGLEGRTLIYLNYTMRNLSDTTLSFTAPDSKFVAFDQNGKNGIFVINAATPLPQCLGAKFQGFSKDVTVKGCNIISLPGNAVSAIGYTDLADPLKLQASWSK